VNFELRRLWRKAILTHFEIQIEHYLSGTVTNHDKPSQDELLFRQELEPPLLQEEAAASK
jgi:hypothetical protein